MDEPVIEFEKNVIEVERDVSTMTFDSGDGVQSFRRRMYRPGHSARYNMFGFTQSREQGCGMNISFVDELSSARLQRLSVSNIFTTVHDELKVTDCEFIRAGFDDSSVAGVWTGDAFQSIMYKVEFDLNSTFSTMPDESPVVVKKLNKKGPYFSKTRIVDLCSAPYRQEDCVIFGGVYNHVERSRGTQALVCCFPLPQSSSSSASQQHQSGQLYVMSKDITCVSGTRLGDKLALGTTDGIYVFKEERYEQRLDYFGRITCIEFNSAGQLMYCGTNTSLFYMLDYRDNSEIGSTIDIDGLCPFGVSEAKLLSDETAMIVSGNDGSLSKVDLRNLKVVLHYSGHAGSSAKVPFTFNKRVNILCATGSDNVTRLWSLDEGMPLSSVKPHYQNRVHSCLVCSYDKWAVALFQKDQMYTMEPSI